jgi:intracellular septation protein
MSTNEETKEETGSATRLLIDLGPLIVFFVANFLAPVPGPMKIFVATGAFMIAMIGAMLLSQIRFGKISAMLWFSGVMVVVMGGITIWLHNETFIKIKPTLYYSLIAGILGFGLLTGRPLLKTVLGSSYPGLDPSGWRKLTRNWVFFFIAMAIVNELVWRNTSTDFWVSFKLWGAIPLTFLFAIANVPMLIRHGLNVKDAKTQEPGPIE